MATLTDEQKEEIVQKYKDADPTPQNSTEIVKELADEYGHSANGIRMIIQKRGAYVNKEPAKKSTTAASGDKPARVSKEAAHQRLTDAITAAGQEADNEIISKMTGKAAVYFAEVLEATAAND